MLDIGEANPIDAGRAPTPPGAPDQARDVEQHFAPAILNLTHLQPASNDPAGSI